MNVFEPSLTQKEVLEGLEGVGGAFYENKSSKLHNLKILNEKERK